MELSVRVHIEPISNNDLYFARPYKGGKGAYLTKTPANIKFEDKIDPMLGELISDEQIELIKEELKDYHVMIYLQFDVYMPYNSFYSADASNYIKAMEDSVKWRIKIDDSRNKRVVVEKFISEDDTWYVDVKLWTEEVSSLTEDRWNNRIKGTK